MALQRERKHTRGIDQMAGVKVTLRLTLDTVAILILIIPVLIRLSLTIVNGENEKYLKLGGAKSLTVTRFNLAGVHELFS